VSSFSICVRVSSCTEFCILLASRSVKPFAFMFVEVCRGSEDETCHVVQGWLRIVLER
jgi:hypothetical protein